MRYGLFIHWVGCSPKQGSGLVYPDGKSIGVGKINDYAESIDVEKVADEIEALGSEYVMITDFHGFGTMLRPSEVSDRWRGEGYASKRDVIGEMIDALRKRGIGFILFTHPLAGHTYLPEQRELHGWDDPTDNHQRWNDFVNEVYAELAERYGNRMMGMGFDSEFGFSKNKQFSGKLDLRRLRKTILSRAPNLQLYGLAAPNDTCEFGLKEIWRPSWHLPWNSRKEDDYEVETWPAYRRMVAVVQAHHWATIRPASKGIARLTGEQLYRYTVLQASAATEGPGVAWAASPYPDGSWENNIGEEFAKLASYIKPVRQSLTRVYPSTSYPTPELAQIAKLPHGFVATKSTDDSVEYIHVLNPPKGKTLSLPAPADKKKFTSAELLTSGNEVTLSQTSDGVTLTLGDNDNWDQLKTVISLDVDRRTIPKQNLALHQKVIASSTIDNDPIWPPRSDFGRVRLVDGQTQVWAAPEWTKPDALATGNSGYSSERGETPREEWVGVNLGKLHQVSEVRLYPRDDKGNEGRGFPVDLRVEVSLDGRDWETVASRSGIPQDDGVQIVEFKPVEAQYVRVVGSKLRQNPDDRLYSMQIVELEVCQ